MKTFQGLLGCLIIICYVQYNASAAPSQIHNNHNQETEVDNQEMPLRLEALEEFYEDQKSERKEGDKDIPTNQADVIYRRQVDYGPLMQIAYTVYSCDFLTLLNSVQGYLDVSNVMYSMNTLIVNLHISGSRRPSNVYL